MAKCEICGKGPMTGNNVSFSQKKTRRRWKPNIQKTTIIKNGTPQTVKLCSRCLRTAAKN